MRPRNLFLLLTVALILMGSRDLAAETGDPENGRRLFGACRACHSLAPGRHMTGPSLAHIWGRKAGTVEGFTRYSRALAEADIVWDQHSLDRWLADPRAFIPGNRMTIPGLPEEAQRQDLIAFLQSISQEASSSAGEQTESMPGGMMSGEMMRQGQMLDLKELDAINRITSISHCGDTYTVMAETEEAYEFWEFNLRFKTDGSDLGPVAGHPVIVPASMRGDRAFVIFASPAEISAFIRKGC